MDGVSLTVHRGATLGIVGESGCGKSVTALSILRLLHEPPAEIVGGTIHFEGTDLLTLAETDLQRIRGNAISMIFQEPMTSLNPVMTVGRQIGEILERHSSMTKGETRDRTVELLEMVRMPEAQRRLHDYPHNLSGGMRQRVMIAIALACNPRVLIADEPTTALDVTIQAQIIDLMRELQERLGTAIIMITHDLGVIAEVAQNVVVMYAGQKVEEATAEMLFETPRHPYTRGLLAAVPHVDRSATLSAPRKRLAEIPGIVPSLRALPAGCSFAPRCVHATDRCRNEAPPLEEKPAGHWVACWESDRLVGP